MLNTQVANTVLDHALHLGADFCDLFIEKNESQNIRILDRSVEEIKSGIDFGIGIRLLYNNKVLYAYSNSLEKENLLDIVSMLSLIDKTGRKIDTQGFSFEPVLNQHKIIQGLKQYNEMDNKINWLMNLDQAARKSSMKISQVDVQSIQRFQKVEIFNTLGIHTQDVREYTRITGGAIAEDGNEKAQCFHAPGAMAGWEFVSSLDPKEFGEDIANRAVMKLTAFDCPAGKMPVVVDKGFGGVIFHEACGHLLETTSVEKKASVFYDKIGKKIASDVVNAVDDGTSLNVWGSSNIDDEGMPTQKTQLIKNGVLNNFMVDYVGHLKTNYERTGSGRRQSYMFPPAARMRNTYIEKGNSTLDEMITSIDNGIYAKYMGGGSVKPGTGEFNFSVDEAYLIKDGKIDKPLKSATLIGTGPDVLKKISMVGNEISMAVGMCGSVSGNVPVTIGQPAVKIDDILVGGKA